jgi:hypothetical protein
MEWEKFKKRFYHKWRVALHPAFLMPSICGANLTLAGGHQTPVKLYFYAEAEFAFMRPKVRIAGKNKTVPHDTGGGCQQPSSGGRGSGQTI